MVRHFLAVSALLAGSVLGFSAAVKAEPVGSGLGEVQFAGNIPSVCDFSNSVSGKISLSNDAKSLGSDPNAYRGGTTGLIDISCTGSATLTVSDPIQVSGATNTTNNTAVIYTNSGIITSPSGTSAPKSAVLNAGFSQKAARVDMTASSNDRIVGGDYKYKVLITAAPN